MVRASLWSQYISRRSMHQSGCPWHRTVLYMWQCSPVIDLLCEKYQWLLQWYVCRRLLRLRPTLLQWDLQRVLR